ncbi:hypothetical protein [Microcoleus vaginatus]|uniref:hypothetical protein n=1 Tax=Microcoleus vaginatus TaxID=119532 RepID=UPI00403FBADD
MTYTQPQIKPQDIKVKILLTGGHQCTVTLKSDTPLLHSLIKTLVDRTQQTPGFSTLFQIPIDGGRSALSFPGENLVGLVTEPPIYLQETATAAACNSRRNSRRRNSRPCAACK